MAKTIMSRSANELYQEDEKYNEYKIKLDDIDDTIIQLLYNDPTLTVDRFFSTTYMKENVDKRRKYIYFYSEVNNVEHGENKDN